MIERLEQRSVGKIETAKLKKFAQNARRSLLEQVSAKFNLVLADNSIARRENTDSIKQLEEAIKTYGKDQVVERVAYIWFNRFCALRFMDVNRYTRIGVVSPAEGQVQPEILAEAKMGYIDEEMVHDKIRQQIFALLDGKAPSQDSQSEAYRLLVVATCNYWNKAMPFLFQRIDDYTELLMPDDLLSSNSILAHLREAISPDACEDVEVIGWLYQFYISEKKDEIFDGLKKGNKITPENIPAATQLFTPNWIVRYLVENSLGRLWMLNQPTSSLIEKMEFFIEPKSSDCEFPHIGSPEEIKICDPACGSGHMLVYAFDLLYAIYEEQGYNTSEIPEKILSNNLYGIELDERAAELAAFALAMKSRKRDRRFFSRGVAPKICVLENISFSNLEIHQYERAIGRGAFSRPILDTLNQFEEASNFGSLIRPFSTEIRSSLEEISSQETPADILVRTTHRKLIKAFIQADYLSPKYHIVIANPPYMGPKQMNARLKKYGAEEFPDSKTDLYAMFLERSFSLAVKSGFSAFVTMHSWMFLSSFAKLREKLLCNKSLLTLAHLGAGAFGSISGEIVAVAAFCFQNMLPQQRPIVFFRLVEGDEQSKRFNLQNRKNCFVQESQLNFKSIPGSPIAYWVSSQTRELFQDVRVETLSISDGQNITANNDAFVRMFWEIDSSSIGRDRKWLPYAKGGPFRRWYGNIETVVNWSSSARLHYRSDPSARIIPEYLWYRRGITWSRVGTGLFGFRLLPAEATFDKVGSSIFVKQEEDLPLLLGILNTKVAQHLLEMLNPSVDLQVRDVRNIPVSSSVDKSGICFIVERLIEISVEDWNSSETSLHFLVHPLIKLGRGLLKEHHRNFMVGANHLVEEMHRCEQRINDLVAESYGIKEHSEVLISEVSLLCNSSYRYSSEKNASKRERLLQAEVLRDLISYSVGCMFGRYALDKPGLILANQGETIQDYLKLVPESSFPADDDNVIPMLDGDWFTDDITERFREFLRVAFGEDHYEENIKFVEQGLNIKGKRNYSIRDYFLNEFYNDHVKRYKKRPIYWLFSSPKGSFNALIYMHRYRPDTISVVLNDYLREFRTKLNSHKNHLEEVSRSGSASQTEKTKALKEVEKVKKMIVEMEDYERDVLYPLATEQVAIDLDDGVKVNYPKFGAALKKIAGLEAKDE